MTKSSTKKTGESPSGRPPQTHSAVSAPTPQSEVTWDICVCMCVILQHHSIDLSQAGLVCIKG